MNKQRMILLVCLLWLPALTWAQSCEERGVREKPLDQVAQGGRLYDKWWTVCNLPEPKGTHPAYPSVGKKSGADTWRCKECHGWDYRGKNGAYGKGSHFTGIAGIASQSGRPEVDIVAILKNDTHRFNAVMSDQTLQHLARFVSQGQFDSSAKIDQKKQVAGRVAVGKKLYARQCMACHGAGGRAMNFSGQANAPAYVGTIAADNPWEMLHKIRNGQPGAVMQEAQLRAVDPDASGAHMGGRMRGHMPVGFAMPAFRTRLSVENQLDLLAFLQTLPSE